MRRLAACAAEQHDHLAIERRNIVGLAAGDEVAIDDGLLIDPLRTGIMQVGSSGQGYVEYAVILLLVVVVLVVLLIFIGPQIASMFQGIENNL